jgi:hypothetical protein
VKTKCKGDHQNHARAVTSGDNMTIDVFKNAGRLRYVISKILHSTLAYGSSEVGEAGFTQNIAKKASTPIATR